MLSAWTRIYWYVSSLIIEPSLYLMMAREGFGGFQRFYVIRQAEPAPPLHLPSHCPIVTQSDIFQTQRSSSLSVKFNIIMRHLGLVSATEITDQPIGSHQPSTQIISHSISSLLEYPQSLSSLLEYPQSLSSPRSVLSLSLRKQTSFWLFVLYSQGNFQISCCIKLETVKYLFCNLVWIFELNVRTAN